MFRSLSMLAAAMLLASCGMPAGGDGALGGTGVVDTSLDFGAFGGLTSDLAAHPSVQLARPKAFALTAESSPFLEALARSVEPERRSIASQLAADATVTRAVSRWDRLSGAERLEAMRRVAAIEGEVMGFQVPPITPATDIADQENVQAYYQPESDGLGNIVVYPGAMARGSAYRAIATIVHEARHAAQFQLAFGNADKAGDDQLLGEAFANAWQITTELGDESKLAYGDYVHLNAEYDAFQTGNEVAAILSGGQQATQGYGFVDMQYDRAGGLAVDPLQLAGRYTGRELIKAVNQAEYEYERSHGTQTLPRQRERRAGPMRRFRVY
jgi:hypothetical protein